MLSPDTLIDGNFLKATAIGARRYEYPFRKNRDRVSALFQEDYWQTKVTWTPQEYPIPHEEDKTYYLIAESDPVEILANVWQFTRTYSRIPATQTVPASRGVSKPALAGPFPKVVGDVVIDQPNPDVPSYVFYTHKLVTADSGAPDGSHPTGGTYALTFGAYTTSGLAYNASNSTVQSAVNALASISNRTTTVVTGSYTAGFAVVPQPYSPATLDITNLTGTFTHTTSVTPIGTGWFSFILQIGNQASGGIDAAGTFDLTVFSQTATLDWTDTAAQMQTKLTALSKVGSGGATVVGAAASGAQVHDSLNRSLKIIVSFVSPAASISGAALTPTGSSATGNDQQFNGFTYSMLGSASPTRVVFAAAHGIVASDTIIVTVDAATVTLNSGQFTVPDANTISFTSSAGAAVFLGTAITAVGKANGDTYEADSVNVPVDLVTSYFLPGVSPGITTTADIPLPIRTSSGTALLSAIFGGVTSVNYEIGEITQWRDTPIIMFTVVKLNPQLL